MNVRFWSMLDNSSSAFYRCHEPARALQLLGYPSSVGNNLSGSDVAAADLVLAQLDPNESRILGLQVLAVHDVILTVDVDEDFFHLDATHPAHALATPDVLAALSENLRRATSVTVADKQLAQVVGEHTDAPIQVLASGVPESLLTMIKPHSDRIVLGWAGSLRNGSDVATARSCIDGWLENIVIDAQITGADFQPSESGAGPARERLAQDMGRHYATLTTLDIGLLPGADIAPNSGGSDIRYLELAALGVAVIASAHGPGGMSIEHGVTGFLAQDDADWHTYLRLLSADPDLRAQIGGNARRYAATRTTEANPHEVADTYQNTIRSRPSRLGGHDRRSIILQPLNTSTGNGLEIGPLYAPIATKDKTNVKYADVFSTEMLRSNYAADPGVPCEDIVDVDFVMIQGQETLSLVAATAEATPFDWVIASHVIEHVPDLVQWLNEIGEILIDGGLLSLAIPDRRYTFDARRPATTIGQILLAHHNRDTRPSVRAVFDHCHSTMPVSAAEAWRSGPPSDDAQINDLALTWAQVARTAQDGIYVDAHVWLFTPTSFVEQLRVLAELGLLEFTVDSLQPTAVNNMEFYAVLRRIPRGLDAASRSALFAEGFARPIENHL